MAEIDPRPPNWYFDAPACPDCDGGLVSASQEQPHLLYCERCQKYFEIPRADRDDWPARENAPDTDDQLSALRIRQFATARRAAYRARSYAVMAAGVCIIAVVQLVWMTIRHVRGSGWGKQPIGYALFAVIAAGGVWYFITRAIALHREAKRSALPEPSTPPDFSTLDDGSKRWKNLEDVR